MYRLSGKGEQIQRMFGEIAPRYDFLNRLLSLGTDQRWRRFTVLQLQVPPGGSVLDVATGTGDVALQVAAVTAPSVTVHGIDFCREMVEIGRKKVAESEYASRITLDIAPCEDIPFPDSAFDGATIAFGIRNVIDRALGLAEMYRVLKPGGRIVILEPSHPESEPFRSLYGFYFSRILPFIGGLFSRKSAYEYLHDSVSEFPPRKEFKALMEKVGFRNVRHHDLTFGIATVYVGEK